VIDCRAFCAVIMGVGMNLKQELKDCLKLVGDISFFQNVYEGMLLTGIWKSSCEFRICCY
jgi:hypothetical protein